MKFSLFCGQEKKFLQEADEIYFRDKDYDMLYDLIEVYPEKDFVIQCSTPKNWQEISAANQNIKGTIYCALDNMYFAEDCRQYGLKFFYSYPVNTFYELKGLVELGVSYIRVGMPLFFYMKELAAFNIPVRLTPNKAYESYIPRKDGINGQWIRPEDLHLYEKIGLKDVICEFRTFDIPLEGSYLVYEQTLFDIYKNKQKWEGRLCNIVKDLGVENLNSTIDEEIGYYRLNCHQACVFNRCHYCDIALRFDEMARLYKEKK